MSPLFGRGSPAGKIDTVVGEHARIQGNLVSEAGLRVDGHFEGSIESGGLVIIGDRAEVVADITAHSVQVAGALKGGIQVTSRVEILPTGRVWGDVTADAFLIHEGGFYRGTTTMRSEEEFEAPLRREQRVRAPERPARREAEQPEEPEQSSLDILRRD